MSKKSPATTADHLNGLIIFLIIGIMISGLFHVGAFIVLYASAKKNDQSDSV